MCVCVCLCLYLCEYVCVCVCLSTYVCVCAAEPDAAERLFRGPLARGLLPCPTPAVLLRWVPGSETSNHRYMVDRLAGAPTFPCAYWAVCLPAYLPGQYLTAITRLPGRN